MAGRGPAQGGASRGQGPIAAVIGQRRCTPRDHGWGACGRAACFGAVLPGPEGRPPRRRLARIPSPPAPAAGGQGRYGRGCGGHRSGCARRTRRPGGPKPEHADPPLRSRPSRPAETGEHGRRQPAGHSRPQAVKREGSTRGKPLLSRGGAGDVTAGRASRQAARSAAAGGPQGRRATTPEGAARGRSHGGRRREAPERGMAGVRPPAHPGGAPRPSGRE